MKYKALTTLYGDYGHVQKGQIFDVPDDTGTQKNMRKLEGKGCVMRYRPPIERKAYTAYQNKMVSPPENKSGPIKAPIRSER